MANNNLNNKKDVLEANKKIHQLGLAFQNFGNVSGRYKNDFLIKPSGVDLSKINHSDIVEIDLKSEKVKKDNLKPSSDTPTHLVLYKKFPDIGGIAHTHSLYATSWAQSGKKIPCLGTTHADYWNGPIPLTRQLNEEEIITDYEKNTGEVIVEKLEELSLSPFECPGIIVPFHGPFTWGRNVSEAIQHAEILEYVAKQAYLTFAINSSANSISDTLLEKHYYRKHGPNSYYGQDSKK